MSNFILVEAEVLNSDINVWNAFTDPKHIIGWNFASDDWCCPSAEVKLIPSGTFNYRMEAKDGSFGFNLIGRFNHIEEFNQLKYTLEDDRKVEVYFKKIEGGVKVSQFFEPENQNSTELQQQGWQAILNNFKKYTELI